MNLYPPSPDKVNPGYTRLPLSYNLKALLAILAILLFFVLYIVLVVSLLFMVKWAFTYPMLDINKLTILGKLGACLGSVMLFLFTLQNRNPGRFPRIEIQVRRAINGSRASDRRRSVSPGHSRKT